MLGPSCRAILGRSLPMDAFRDVRHHRHGASLPSQPRLRPGINHAFLLRGFAPPSGTTLEPRRFPADRLSPHNPCVDCPREVIPWTASSISSVWWSSSCSSSAFSACAEIHRSNAMTTVGPAPAGSSTAPAGAASFVEWGAVIAGAFLAAAISFVLLTFGAAIGLSAVSPWPNSGASAKVIASLAVFWAMAQQIGSIMVGGYVAGRMRSRWHEPGHEAEFRDGLHGALVWAVAVLLSALLVFMTAGVAASTGADIAGKAVGSVASSSDPMDAVLDTMLGPTATAQAAA